MTKFRVLFRKTWRIFSSVNHNNVYGRWITTWYLRQMKRTANSTTVDSTNGRKSSPRKIYKKKLRKSEIVDLKFSVSSKAVLFFFSPLSVVRPTQILGIFQKKSNDLVKPIFTWNNSFNLKNEHSNSIEKNKNKNRNIFVHFVNPNMWMLTFNFILGYQGSSYSETSCNSFFFFDEEREHRLPTFQQNAVNRIRNESDEKRQVYSQNYLLHEEYLSSGLRTAFSPFYSKLYFTIKRLKHR